MTKRLCCCLLVFGCALVLHALPVLAAEDSAADELAAIFAPAAEPDGPSESAFCSARAPEDAIPPVGRGRLGPQTKAFICAARCVDGSYVSCVTTSPICSEFVVNARCPSQKGYCLDRFTGIHYCPPCNSCKGAKCV